MAEKLTPSILDRLIDLHPKERVEPMEAQSVSLEIFEQRVLRDVEALLNSRHGFRELSEDTERELAKSCLTYGVADLSCSGVAASQDRELIRGTVERALLQFEPRLLNTRVKLHEPESQHDRSVHLTIECVLCVNPIRVALSFDTIVHTQSGDCDIRGSH